MTRPARRHGWALAAVVGAVTLMHAWLGGTLLAEMADLRPQQAPERLRADFVAEVRLQQPAAPAFTPPAAQAAPVARAVPRRRPRPLPPPPAASAPQPEASAVAQADQAASAPQPPASGAESSSDLLARAMQPASAASGATPGADAASAVAGAPPLASSPAASPTAVAAGASAPGAPSAASSGDSSAPSDELLFGFPWPRSTRIRYALTGQYRGEVRGSAEVLWLREGTRYQVHVDTLVGPRFAPLFQRNISSDGQITAEGLAPRRYDEESKVAFSRRHRHVTLAEAEVVFTNGEREARWPGVQDLASQFVQLTWRFLRDPGLLAAGRTIELPVAMSKQQRMLVFDVMGQERLATRLGEIPAIHLRPRMPPGSAGKLGGDLLVELWFAPQLEYLPVRLRIAKDEATYVDLLIDRLPERAAPASPAGAAAAGASAPSPALR